MPQYTRNVVTTYLCFVEINNLKPSRYFKYRSFLQYQGGNFEMAFTLLAI